MKSRIGMFVVVLFVFAFVLAPLAGCSGATVSQEDAEEAFLVGFSSVLMASFSAAFGDAPEGVELSEDNLTMTLDNLDITEFEGIDYTAVSGTVTNQDNTMKCDLTLTGGTVESIIFELGEEAMQKSSFNLEATVNGKTMTIDITEEELAELSAAS